MSFLRSALFGLLLVCGQLSVTQSQAACGEDVTINQRDYTYIEYKRSEVLEQQEECVWFIKSNLSQSLRAQLAVVEEGFEDGAGLTLFTLNRDGSYINSTLVAGTGTTISFELYPSALLIFTANKKNAGRGFRVGLIATGVVSEVALEPNFVRIEQSSKGLLEYPGSGQNYSANERTLIYLNPQASLGRRTEYYLDFLDIQGSESTCNDALSFRTVGKLGEVPVLESTLCGYEPNGRFSQLLSADQPLLILFRSDASVNQGGFKIQWQPEPASTVCGDDVTITEQGYTYIQYAQNEDSTEQGECVWFIQADVSKSTKASLVVVGDVESETPLGLTLVSLDSDGTAVRPATVPSNGTRLDFSMYPSALLIFAPSSSASKGFRVALIITEMALEATVLSSQLIRVNQTERGLIEYPGSGLDYGADERVFIYLNPPSPSGRTQYYLDFLDIEGTGSDCRDALNFHTPGSLRDVTPSLWLSTICGDEPNGRDFPIRTTDYPLIILFHSNFGVNGRGFIIDWQPEPIPSM